MTSWACFFSLTLIWPTIGRISYFLHVSPLLAGLSCILYLLWKLVWLRLRPPIETSKSASRSWKPWQKSGSGSGKSERRGFGRYGSIISCAIICLGLGFLISKLGGPSKAQEIDWVYVQADQGCCDYDFLLPDGSQMHGHYCTTETEPEFGHGEIALRLRWIPAWGCWSRRGVEPSYTLYREGEDKHVVHTTESAYRAMPETRRRSSAPE